MSRDKRHDLLDKARQAKDRRKGINFERNTFAVAEMLDVEPESRNPHTKTGTGSSGTDHSRANARAANLGKERVREAIQAETGGVNMSPTRFLHEKEKEAAAAESRAEKQAAIAEKQDEVRQRNDRDYKNWLNHLAWKKYPSGQDSGGNDYQRPVGSYSDAEKKAIRNGWPLEWRAELQEDLFGGQ